MCCQPIILEANPRHVWRRAAHSLSRPRYVMSVVGIERGSRTAQHSVGLGGLGLLLGCSLSLHSLSVRLGLAGVTGGVLRSSCLTLRASLAALLNSGGDDGGQQVCGTDRVVVARDRVLDLVRVAVGVQDGDNRDA